jgi:GTPase KRas protein
MLDILDTAGQEEFACMKDQWIRGGEGFIIVYSITDRKSFDDVTKHREFIFKVKDADCGPMVMIGNKCDLETERHVSATEGAALAQNLGIKFLEVSAKSGKNVDETFATLVREVRRYTTSAAPSK